MYARVCLHARACLCACVCIYLHVCQKIKAMYVSACGVYVKSVVLFNSACLSGRSCLSGSKQEVEHALCCLMCDMVVKWTTLVCQSKST